VGSCRALGSQSEQTSVAAFTGALTLLFRFPGEPLASVKKNGLKAECQKTEQKQIHLTQEVTTTRPATAITPGPRVALRANQRCRFNAALPLPRRATGLCENNGLKAECQKTEQKEIHLTHEVR
jgi:hypothetical protein